MKHFLLILLTSSILISIIEAAGSILVNYDQFVQPNPNYNGATGQRGQPGQRGLQGPQGDPGLKGDKGDPGPEGDKGPPGPRGPPGPNSTIPGAVGPTGDTGVTGTPGATGIKGPTGDIGDRGQTGLPGPTGPPGPDGGVGPKGKTGSPGLAGLPGPDGVQGERGLRGEKGDQGPPGASPGDPWTFDWDKYPPYYCSQSNPSCEKPRCDGVTCVCAKGLIYDPETRSCTDDDECAPKKLPSACDSNQLCVNTPGSYRCYNASLVQTSGQGLSAAQESYINRQNDDRRTRTIPGLIVWLAILTVLEITLLIVEITCHSRRRCGSSSSSTSSGYKTHVAPTSPGSYVITPSSVRMSGNDQPAEQFFLNPAHIFPDLHTVDDNMSPETERQVDPGPPTSGQGAMRRRPISNDAYQSVQAVNNNQGQASLEGPQRINQGQVNRQRSRAPAPPVPPKPSRTSTSTAEMMIQ